METYIAYFSLAFNKIVFQDRYVNEKDTECIGT